MDKIHEYDINTGEIIRCLYVQRRAKNKLYENNEIYENIKKHVEFILKENHITTHRWENMTEQLKEWNLRNEFTDTDEIIGKTSFLWHRGELQLTGTQIPNSFDEVYYNSNCVFNYVENDDFKRSQFYLFFALKISFFDITKMDDFLNYQLKKNFNNKKEKYFDFLENVLMQHLKLIEEGKIEKVRKYLNKFSITSLPPKIDEKFDFPVEAYSPKDLQRIYNIGAKTLTAWLKPYKNEIGELRGRTYTIKQVKVIFSKIDTPQK